MFSHSFPMFSHVFQPQKNPEENTAGALRQAVTPVSIWVAPKVPPVDVRWEANMSIDRSSNLYIYCIWYIYIYIYIYIYQVLWMDQVFLKKGILFLAHHSSPFCWEGFIHPGEELGERLLGHLYGSLLRPRAWWPIETVASWGFIYPFETKTIVVISYT